MDADGPSGTAATGAPERDAARPWWRLPVRVWIVALLLLAGAGTFVVAWAQGWVSPAAIQRAAREAGPWAMAVFAGAVLVGELIWMPRMWGLVAGGLLFGPILGGLLSLGADLASALLTYALARTGARAWVAGLLARRPKADRIVRLLAERKGAWSVLVLRLCPIAHYTLVSIAAGVSGVRPGPYLLGTAVGILPGAILYPLLGDSISRPTSPVFLGGMAVLIVALIVTLRLGRKVLQER